MPNRNTNMLLAYKRLPNWTANSIPKTLLNPRNTKVGTWEQLTILSGKLDVYFLIKMSMF
ncbi:tellurite resistance protein TehB [Streptococcus troglodytae]|uniref:Tellurite resistance protein TehB n=1 Tax=Streptococcus troglodytae TaxID=1111760 RepID=A0A1L7LHZ4_9STRE|nr:tellurite resistance protein TehB [Streptococcus troglodytae]